MTIVQISDTHLLPVDDKNHIALKRADNLERCVATINNLTVQPEAVVHTGDMINFGRNNGYGLAGEILSELKAPFFPAIGNRDSRQHMVRQFLSPHVMSGREPFCQYRIELPGTDILCIDTKSDTQNLGALCPARLRQIASLLQRSPDRPVFVFMHHPPVRIEALKNPLQFAQAENVKMLQQILDRHDNIVRILSGHTHRSDVLNMGRHTISTIASLATDVRLDQYSPRLAGEPVFQIHTLEKDGRVTSMSHFAERCMSRAA